MYELALGNWSDLRVLDVSCNLLDTSAIAQLVQVSMPALRTLNLSRNNLGQSAIAILVTAKWAGLQLLQMEYQQPPATDQLDLTEMLRQLAVRWPNVRVTAESDVQPGT